VRVSGKGNFQSEESGTIKIMETKKILNIWRVGNFVLIYLISDFLPLKPRTNKSTTATKSSDNQLSRF